MCGVLAAARVCSCSCGLWICASYVVKKECHILFFVCVRACTRPFMSVSIQVSVRCRPFVCDDELGVSMFQNSPDEGEINLLRSKYSTNRFAFSWAWWSAYGYKNHCASEESKNDADSMKLIDQATMYEACGKKIQEQLYDGNAIVLFAYGLSGSGKTFTVFGPDAVDIPEAWFKWSEPHKMWGVFPHLAYECFQDREDGWKLTMKYFQNVVDIVRDLMSPVAQEQNYKQGMRKDKDGFTDIEWCSSAVLKDWDAMRTTFQGANARKAIAPTQFNPQSTRGHCIMTLEVEKPKKDDPSTKQKGRVYVCDLAGTEPAGDVVYAMYKKKKFDDGSIENQYQGPHPDKQKTKELQDQGKKINLSLSEMAQFFMKMADAIKKKKLKPGQSIPGCNSYFLCKYLKDTMLCARTYLFCAIRPEVKFHPYTFSTLGFAKNASVIKLQPKKATTAATPAERKLMEELEKMKLMMAELQAGGGGGGGNDPAKDAEIQRLQEMLANQQKNLADELAGSGGHSESDAMLERQKQEYGRRGIVMTAFGSDETEPFFVNIDEDEFRSERFMYVLREAVTVFGTDIRPTNFAIKAGHCSVSKAEDGTITLTGGNGETYHNGAAVTQGNTVTLAPFDRVAMATDLMLLRIPGKEPEGEEHMPNEDMIAELHAAKMSKADAAAMKQIEEERQRFEKERAELQREMEKIKAAAASGGEEARKAQLEMDALKQKQEEEAKKMHDTMNRQQMLELIPQVDESNHLLGLLNRPMLSAEALLRVGLSEDGEFSVPQVKVKISNKFTDDIIYLDPFEFKQVWQVMKDEVGFLRSHLADGTEYYANEFHEPMTMLYGHSYEIGTAILFVESLVYMLETDEEERFVDIKNVGDPNHDYGTIEIVWTPLGDQDEQGNFSDDVPDITDPAELLGKQWNCRMEILGISKLPIQTESTYCQYNFFGQTYTTEVVQQVTNHPHFSYSYVHHVDEVTQEFVDYLSNKSITVHVYVDPFISQPPKDKIASTNKMIAKNLGFAESDDADLRAANAKLRTEVDKLTKENIKLWQRIKELEGASGVKMKLEEAKSTDAAVNG